MREALQNDDFESFLDALNKSGISSWTMLQNVIVPSDSVSRCAVSGFSK